jgi:hypothetical protein
MEEEKNYLGSRPESLLLPSSLGTMRCLDTVAFRCVEVVDVWGRQYMSLCLVRISKKIIERRRKTLRHYYCCCYCCSSVVVVRNNSIGFHKNRQTEKNDGQQHPQR